MKIAPILQSFQARVQATVQNGVQTTVSKADQVLLGLTHSGAQLLEQTLNRIESNPDDLFGRVGRNVFQRAEDVRKQLIEKRLQQQEQGSKTWVPGWLEDVKFVAEKNDETENDETEKG